MKIIQSKSHRVSQKTGAVLRVSVTLAALAILGLLAGCGSSDHGTHLAYVAAGQDVFAYRLDNNSGAPTAITGSPFLTGTSPASILVHPSNQFLYLANQGDNTISRFKIDSSSGALTEVTPRTPTDISPAAMTMDRGGTFLFVANQASNDVIAFSIASDGTLTQVSSASVGSSPAGLTLSNSGNFLFVPVPNFSAIYVFGVNGGVLTPMGSFVIPNGVSSLAIDSSDKFLFVPNPSTNTLTVLQQTAGVISAGSGAYSVGTTPVAAALDASGKYLYVANFGSGNVSQFSFDASTGVLTDLTTTTVAAGTNPVFIVVDPGGKFIFVGNQGSGSITGFTVGPKGGLTATGTPIQVGATPRSLSLTR